MLPKPEIRHIRTHMSLIGVKVTKFLCLNVSVYLAKFVLANIMLIKKNLSFHIQLHKYILILKIFEDGTIK